MSAFRLEAAEMCPNPAVISFVQRLPLVLIIHLSLHADIFTKSEMPVRNLNDSFFIFRINKYSFERDRNAGRLESLQK